MEVGGSPLPELVKEAFSDPAFQRERSCRKPSCCLQEDAHGECAGAFGSEGGRPSPGVCHVYSGGLETVQTTAGKSNGNPGFLDVIASGFSKFCGLEFGGFGLKGRKKQMKSQKSFFPSFYRRLLFRTRFG